MKATLATLCSFGLGLWVAMAVTKAIDPPPVESTLQIARSSAPPAELPAADRPLARLQPAPSVETRSGVVPAAFVTTEVAPPHASESPADDSAQDFWRGLARHEIQLEQKLLVVKGSRGIVACPYLNVETFARTGEACAIVPAADTEGMLASRVTAVTPKAKDLGIRVGMSGREALDKIR